jgi:hypothetical protein
MFWGELMDKCSDNNTRMTGSGHVYHELIIVYAMVNDVCHPMSSGRIDCQPTLLTLAPPIMYTKPTLTTLPSDHLWIVAPGHRSVEGE